MARKSEEQRAVRRYLLRQLDDAQQQSLELQLLSDESLSEELEISEDELIDEYLADELSRKERVRFEQHFLATPERKQKLAAGRALRRHLAGSVPEPAAESDKFGRLLRWLRKVMFSSPAAVAMATLAVAVLGFGIWRGVVYQSDVDKGLVALNKAYSQSRPIDARITQLNYAPFIITRGGPELVNAFERDRAGLLLINAVREHPSAASYHALGKYYLTQRDSEKAIQYFEEARKLDAKNAAVYADLGAAYLDEGKRELAAAGSAKSSLESGKGMEHLARSLQNLNQALALDSNLLEPLFNRADVYEAMALLPQAAEDLRTYIRNDSNSKWSDEARARLKRLEQKQSSTSRTEQDILQDFLKQHEAADEDAAWSTVSRHQNRAGNIVVEQLLDAYLDNAGRNQKEADQFLQLLRYVGDLAVRKVDDRFYFELANFYQTATPEQRLLAVKARDLMKRGHAGWGQLEVNQNLELFSEAAKLFEQAGDRPDVRVAEYWMSFCHFRDHDQIRSRQILDPLLQTCETRSYTWLQARGLYLLAAVQFEFNEHSQAVDFAEQAVQIAERTNDSMVLLNAADSLVEYYRYLGNYSKSLAFIQKSLTLLGSTTLDPIQGARHNGVAALALTTAGFHDAAAGYQKEALRLAIKTGSLFAKANNYSFMGLINGRLKNTAEALKDAQLGLDLAQQKAGQPAGRSLLAYASLQLGNVYREADDFPKAIAHYTQSIELYQTFQGFETHLYQAHKGRLLCYLRQQNDLLAREEISTTLNLLAKYRSKISGENSRNTFFNVEHNVFDAAIEFEHSRMQNPEQAFNYLNSAQARSLWDLLNSDKDVSARVRDADIKFQTVSEPLTLAEIKERVPAQAQLLQYAVLEDRVLIWIISRDDFQVKEKQISRKSLNEKLLRYLAIISRPPENDGSEETALARELYSALVQPVESLLGKEKLLCIIPDGTLTHLPFASLISPSGKYFFEERLLMTSPSASVFLNCSENANRKSEARDERILTVGNPRLDLKAYPNLADLPAAAEEADEVSRRYNSRVSLVDDKATAIAVRSELEGSDVVHLALHSSVDDEVPLRSKLLLAKSKGEAAHSSSGSALHSYEIYNLKLPKTRLVVLSACQSGAERYYGGEGMMSLARAFISASVPLVVGSLWPVDSAATKELMVNFHKHRRADGASTVAALGKAQQDLLRGASERYRRPYYWAAFTVNGGYARF